MNPSQAFAAFKSLYPDAESKPPAYLKAIQNTLSFFDGNVLDKLFYLRSPFVMLMPTCPSIPQLMEICERIETEIRKEKAQSTEADFQSIRATELAAHIKAQEAKLPELRKKFPSAYVNDKGDLCYIPDLKRPPTEDEISSAQKWRKYQDAK